MGVYEHDHMLPQLPIPALRESRAELAKRVRPLVDDDAFGEFEKILDDFCAAGGEGEKLQQRLEGWQQKLPGNSSWLRPFWDDSYIASRASLPICLNYTLQLARNHWGEHALGKFAAAMAECIRGIQEESLPAEMAKSYASMDTLQYMVYTRIPAPARDVWYYPPLAEPMQAAVACRGHWFLLALTNEAGAVYSPAVLESGIAEIKKQAAALPPALPVSAFTWTERGRAAALRAEISENLLNRLSLESIEKAVFVICLDEDGLDEETFGKGVVAGDAAGRWFDKSLQIICSGGQLGVNLEHSGCDGSLWAYMLNQVEQQIERDCQAPCFEEGAPYVRLLEWAVPDALAARLQDARQEFAAWAGTMQFSQKRITTITKDAIKARKCSPDAFVQLLFQNAFYRQSGRLRSFYEAVSARAFYQGRTESVRTCTVQSAALLRALKAGAPREELREMIFAACAAHSEDIGRCKQGLGCERHFTGLRAVHRMYAPGAPEHALFSSEGYCALTADAMSTSSITGPAVDYFAFAPVASDGVGLGYGLNADALHVAVTSYAPSGVAPAAFIGTVEQTAMEFFDILSD